MMEAIILAGGLGTRLSSRLQGVPKPMASVAGRPFLDYLLRGLERSGCSRTILSVGHLSNIIQDHVGSQFGTMAVDYVVEESPLGTGGAIRAALPAAQSTSVLVLNGDTFVPLDYKAMRDAHVQHAADVTMAVVEQPNVARYGEVLLSDGRITGFTEKGREGPGWINAGVYVLPSRLEWPPQLPEKFSFETEYLVPEVGNLLIQSFPATGEFIDIGIPEDLDRAQELLAGRF